MVEIVESSPRLAPRFPRRGTALVFKHVADLSLSRDKETYPCEKCRGILGRMGC